MPRSNNAREIVSWIVHIGAAVLAGLFIITFIGQRTVVYGNSMQPTFQPGDQVIVEKITPRFGELKTGDIITIYMPEVMEAGKDMLIKRVIATEGQTVEIKNGKVYVNGAELAEDYINGDSTMAIEPEYGSLQVPAGYVYVLGDNRIPGESKDSRMIGPINMNRIRGKVFVRFYPFENITWF